MRNFALVIAVFFALVSTIDAQKAYWELGFGGGVSSYWGDLNSESFSDNFMNMNPAGNIFLRYNYENFSARSILTIGKLKGSDANSIDEGRLMRNLSFFSPITEFSIVGEYNIFKFHPDDNEALFTPYVSLGVGVLKFDPRTEYNGSIIKLQPLGTEGQGLSGNPAKYKLTTLAIPIGGGFKFRINKNLIGSIEMIGRATFTDYLDDVSTTYAPYNVLLANNGELSANLSQRLDEFLGEGEGSNASQTDGQIRGGPDVNDYYFSFMINLSYNLGSKLQLGGRSSRRGTSCPKF